MWYASYRSVEKFQTQLLQEWMAMVALGCGVCLTLAILGTVALWGLSAFGFVAMAATGESTTHAVMNKLCKPFMEMTRLFLAAWF